MTDTILNKLQHLQTELSKKYGDKDLIDYTKKDIIRMAEAMGEALIDLNNNVSNLHYQLQQAKDSPRIILQ